MSTKEEEPNAQIELPEEFEDGSAELVEFEPEQTDKLMENIYQLETDLDSEKEERREERFIWVLVVTVLINFLAVSATAGSWLFMPIFVLELIALLGYAQRLGVDWAVKLIGWFIHWIGEKFDPNGGS